MERRSLMILGGAAAMAAGAVLALGPGGPPPPDRGTAPLMFQGLAARLQGAMRIEVVRNDTTLVVTRQQGDLWGLPETAGYPVRADKVREILVGLTELRLVEPRTSNPAFFERLGVQDPKEDGSTASLLRVLDGAGKPIAELIVGRRRIRTQGGVPESVYVRRPGETQTWLAEGRLPLDADAQLWIDRDLANIARDRVLAVTVQREGAAPLVLRRAAEPDGAMRLAEPAEHPPLEQTSLDAVAGALEFLTLTDVHKAADIPGSLLGRTLFTLREGLQVTTLLHQEGDALWITLSAQGAEEASRLNARWQGWAYQIGAWKLKALLPQLEDLRKAETGPGQPAR